MERFEFRMWSNSIQMMFYSHEYGSLVPFFSSVLPLESKDVLMQSTGQKDSDGKFIFEGDIVEVNSSVNLYTIVFRGMGFWFVDEEDEGFVFTAPIYNLKVVGNIYEQTQ